MGKREDAVGETRRRIIEATLAAHNEKGIVATTMQDIADRADVALGTVYRHFPTVEELVPACGALIFERNPLPDPAAVFEGAKTSPERLGAAVRALFSYYDANERWISVGYCERSQVRPLDEAMSGFDGYVTGLIQHALGQGVPYPAGAVAMAHFFTWKACRAAGMDTGRASELIASLVDAAARTDASEN
jgi:AcrR family transcriptional regulator